MVAGLGLLPAAVQWASGAWAAGFDGYPDEAAQFISGRVVWEYLLKRPSANAADWAKQYYLHYPKVAIGHWPPAYQAAEAAWFLIFGSSRASVMGLQWFIAWVAVICFYQLARLRFSPRVVLAMIGFMVATPIFQQGLEMAMADTAMLLWSILLMLAIVRVRQRPDGKSIFLVFLILFAAALTKGTAICLMPVPIVALIAGHRRPLVPAWAFVAGAALLAGCAAWYLRTTNIIYWGGITSAMRPPVLTVGSLAGWGFIGLAALGLRRDPLSLLAANILACTVAVSFAARAMTEPRHWIIVLPAILLLSANVVMDDRRRYMALLLAPAIALFPFSWFRQPPGEYEGLLRQLHTPARMLVSGPSATEGGWIAEVAIHEHYPASLVARATKVLAQSGWNGEDYRLLCATTQEVARRLDELAIDIAVVDLKADPSAEKRMPHDVLLKKTLASSSSWRPCGNTSHLLAYCRTQPPTVARKPMVIEAGGWEIVEKLGPPY